MDPSTIGTTIGLERYIDKYGVPVVLLGLIIYAAWRVVPWAKDLVEKLVSRGIAYIDESAKAFSDLAEAILLMRTAFDTFKTETTQRLDHIQGDIEDLKERRR
jgi:uncharacterized lipoprotein